MSSEQRLKVIEACIEARVDILVGRARKLPAGKLTWPELVDKVAAEYGIETDAEVLERAYQRRTSA